MAALAKILPQLLPILPDLLKLLPQLAEALKDIKSDGGVDSEKLATALTSSDRANIAKMNRILSSTQTKSKSRILASAKSVKRG
jgi:hypothetical protein